MSQVASSFWCLARRRRTGGPLHRRLEEDQLLHKMKFSFAFFAVFVLLVIADVLSANPQGSEEEDLYKTSGTCFKLVHNFSSVEKIF